MADVLDARLRRGAVALEWLPVFAGLLVLYVPTFYGLAGTLWQTEDNAHGPIILAVILWMIWQKRDALFVMPKATAGITGFCVLIFGLMLYALGRSQSIFLFEVGALAPILVGVLLATRGWDGMRSFWFPIVFIAFMIPLPGFFVDALTGPLRQAVSAVVERLLYFLGYPIARSGVTLAIGQYELLVADACSGLNSIFSLSALALLYVYLMRSASWLHNGLLLAGIVPIAFCANIARVMILVLVTYYFGDSAGQGVAHLFAGMVLFAIALLMLIAFDGVLRLAGAFGRGRN